MGNRIVIHLPNGYNLVAEQSPNPAYPNEIYVGLVDSNGYWFQDLAIVRNAYTYNGGEIEWKNDECEVLVYSDKNDEDFTHDFSIGIYNGD